MKALKVICFVLTLALAFLAGMAATQYYFENVSAKAVYYVVDEATGDMYSGTMEKSGFENGSFVDAIHIDTTCTR